VVVVVVVLIPSVVHLVLGQVALVVLVFLQVSRVRLSHALEVALAVVALLGGRQRLAVEMVGQVHRMVPPAQ